MFELWLIGYGLVGLGLFGFRLKFMFKFGVFEEYVSFLYLVGIDKDVVGDYG